MGNLPEYTQKTRRLTPNAMAVRTAFNLAKSPKRLLFDELPEALGFKDLVTIKTANEENLKSFSKALDGSLRELRNAYTELLEKQKQLLINAFYVTVNDKLDGNIDLGKLRKALAATCFDLENYTIDTQGLRAFIMRVNKEAGSDKDWLENLLMFLGHKPSNKWLDSDQDIAEYRLRTFSRRVIDLRKLQVHEADIATKPDDDFDVYLLSSIKKGLGVSDKIISVDKHSKQCIEGAKKEIAKNLSELPNKHLAWAALAEIVDEHLRAKPATEQDDIEQDDTEDDANSQLDLI